ncbi:SMP-30/gluconolactonase/LRE family protein [Microbacterium sp. AZCO]|uniref:SMP-30/gluconolactonase/LRE family protein n=1 Tax=Microbacterium sp. AZCO TaxID=3142976 RepID=UPI0031F34A3A
MNAYDDVPVIGVAQVATDDTHFLGEGPTWDPIRGRILWVDIMAGVVHAGRLLDDGSIVEDESIRFPDTAGAVAVSASGELVVAGRQALHYRDLDGQITTGRPLVDGDERRFNDGKADPAGRFLVGTKGPGGEVLLRVDPDETAVIIDDDLGLSNGLAWTPDGRRLYSIDTERRCIFVRDYDPATGATGERAVFAQLEHGHPDGVTMDAEEHLWVAVWGAGTVLRFSPQGEIVGRVSVPVPNTSCPAFAGPGLDTLVITTATEGLSDEDLAASPLSGRLFTIAPGVRGLPPHLWAGRAR